MKDPVIAHQLTIAHFHIWLRLLLRHGISIKHIGKALIITVVSLLLIPIHIINSGIIMLKGRKTKLASDPVFIIGHWRSGTTLLHYLLSKDEKFGYLTYYQGFVPTLCFIGGNFLKRLIAYIIPERRPQDDVHLHADLPTEEENPLATFSLESASLSFYFPKEEQYYDKYVLFQDTSPIEKSKWKRAYHSLMHQIQLRFPGKTLLIKNPHNTGRIKELIELYPKAKFIYLYRNPYEVFPSTLLMYNKVVRTQYLQNYSHQETEQKIFYYFKTILKRYFETRDLIPSDQLIELNYHDFVSEPIRHIERIYDSWNWKMDESTSAALENYLEARKNYKANKHKLTDSIHRQINRDLDFVFEQHDFQLEGSGLSP